MDQVKDALAALKRQHFWVLSVLVVIMSVVVWKIAAGHVAEQFDTRKSELESTLKTVEGIKSDSTHPNENTIAAIKALTEGLTGEVYTTWKFLFAQQSEKNPWPKELGVVFVKMINELPEDGEIARFEDRDKYYYFIKNHFHVLDEIVDSIRVKEPEKEAEGTEAATTKVLATPNPMGISGGMLGRPQVPVETIGKVDWNPADRQRVQSGFVWQSVPTTIQIRLAQEDLWVYEALLRVIAETNVGSTGYHNAAVKRIEALEIGQAAAGGMSSTQLFGRGGGYGSGGSGGYSTEEYDYNAEGGMEDMEGTGSMSGGPGMSGYSGGYGAAAGSSAEAIKARLMNRRYVDQFGQPLTADVAENSPPYAEFKMMPVRLRLLVNQNKIADFLVDCANCTMPIDVRRVSLWPSNATSGRGSYGGSSGMGGGMDMGSGGMEADYGGAEEMYGGMGGGMGGMGSRMGSGGYGGMGAANRSQAEAVTEVSQKDIPIEVQGIVYIFNRPQREKVGTGTADEQEAPPDLAPTAAPAPGTPPPAPPAGIAPPPTPPGAVTPPATPAAEPAAGPPATAPPAAAAPAAAAPAAGPLATP